MVMSGRELSFTVARMMHRYADRRVHCIWVSVMNACINLSKMTMTLNNYICISSSQFRSVQLPLLAYVVSNMVRCEQDLTTIN